MYYIDNPDGTRTPYFQPLMEVKVYAKGRYLASPKAGQIGAENSPRYYVLFWGFITGINESQSGPNVNFTLSCKDMLHWWEYQSVTITQSAINYQYGAKPIASVGTVLRFLNPWELILNLFMETGFDNWVYPTFTSGGQQMPNERMLWELSSGADKQGGGKTNPGGFEILMRKTMAYWDKRFGSSSVVASGKTLDQGSDDTLKAFSSLEMFGFQGKMNLSESFVRDDYANENSVTTRATAPVPEAGQPSQGGKNTDATNSATRETTNTDKTANPVREITKKGDSLVWRLTKPMSVESEVTTDYGLVGKVLPYANFSDHMPGAEASTMSKLEIANTAVANNHMEFYQDVNGTFVFKPPFYNMDTSNTKVYRLMADDITTINESIEIDGIVNGLEVTGPMIYLATTIRPSASHYDFGSIARYGLRYRSMQLPYGNNAQELQALAVAEMSVTNAQATTASVEIPLRPELRLGYPVYIDHLDCFYYIVGINHSFSFGSTATTSLTLTAKRQKVWDYTAGEPMRACIYRSTYEVYLERARALAKEGDSEDTIRAAAVAAIKASMADESIGTPRDSEFKEEASAKDIKDKTSGLLVTQSPGFYTLVKSPAYWEGNAPKTSNAVVKSGGGTGGSNRSLNELVSMTSDSVPYTDVNGYQHIGGFPFGANLSITDDMDINDLTQLGVGQIYDLKAVLELTPVDAVDASDPLSFEMPSAAASAYESQQSGGSGGDGDPLQVVTSVVQYSPEGAKRAVQSVVPNGLFDQSTLLRMQKNNKTYKEDVRSLDGEWK
jgi:hypothetical protein